VADDLRIRRVRGRMAERQVVDCVEHVGLACPVMSDEAVRLRRQFQTGLRNVLVVDKQQFFENHAAKVRFFFVENEKNPNK